MWPVYAHAALVGNELNNIGIQVGDVMALYASPVQAFRFQLGNCAATPVNKAYKREYQQNVVMWLAG